MKRNLLKTWKCYQSMFRTSMEIVNQLEQPQYFIVGAVKCMK